MDKYEALERRELIQRIAEQGNIDARQAERIINDVTAEIVSPLVIRFASKAEPGIHCAIPPVPPQMQEEVK